MAKNELGKDEQYVASRIMLRIESACIAYRQEKVQLRSITFLIEKYLFQLRLLETVPDSNLLAEMIQDYFAMSLAKEGNVESVHPPLQN
jgi:hypothetical protein